MKLNHYQVLRRPLVTEKSMKLKDSDNQLFFEVASEANRIEVKQAVEKVFKVKVKNVNILNTKGKGVAFRAQKGKRKSWKKAIVTLHEGQQVDYLEG
jgi:large subunit ribosomal protein L23